MDAEKRTKVLKTTYSLGARNTASCDRVNNDFYATPPFVVKELLKQLDLLSIKLDNTILDPCVGMGHILDTIPNTYNKKGLDIVDRGWKGTIIQDFLLYEEKQPNTSIILNPPYNIALEFIEHCLDLVDDNAIVCAFLKIQFLETIKRYNFLIKNPPLYVMPYAKRVGCGANGKFIKEGKGNSACMFAWFVWKKGNKDLARIKLITYDK